MTLLCAFFTTLYASALVGTPQAQTPPAPPPDVQMAPAVVTPPVIDPLDVLRARLTNALGDELAAGRLQLVDDRRGLVVEVPEAVAFAPGQADLSPAARETMARIGAAIADLPNAVRVEGHTDDVPIRTARFASNLELSTARATEVVALFVGDVAIAADRLSAAGYGEHRPRAANTTPDGRTRNRRVDIVILNLATETAEEPALEVVR